MSDFSLVTVFFIWVCGFSVLFYLFRDHVVRFFSRSPFPVPVNYYIILTPLVLVEEFLTCETPFFSCIRITLFAFWLFFLLLLIIQYYSRISWQHLVILAGTLGWVNEFILVGRLYVFAISVPVAIIVSVLCIMIYSVLALFPAYYLDTAVFFSIRQK
jgi:hypothetical protein